MLIPLEGLRCLQTMDLRLSASFYWIFLTFCLMALTRQGVHSNSLRNMENRKFKISYAQKNLKLPDSACGSKILRKRSIPYNTWLTGFEQTQVNCQIIELTSPVPTIIIEPATTTARSTIQPATTRQRTTAVKARPTTRTSSQVVAPDIESRLFYLAPFVPYNSYFPTIRYHDVPQYTPQYSSFFPYYHSGYYPSNGADTFYNLLMFGNRQREGSSEEDNRRKREAPREFTNTSPVMAAMKKQFANYFSSREVMISHLKHVSTPSPGTLGFQPQVSSHSLSPRFFRATPLFGRLEFRKEQIAPPKYTLVELTNIPK